MTPINFQTINWESITPSFHQGEKGTAEWRTLQFDSLRIRLVEYSDGYLANHWCKKGHILHCMEGELITELDDGRTFTLKPGMSYVVSDNYSVHRSSTINGVKLLIIDGAFLHPKQELNPWRM